MRADSVAAVLLLAWCAMLSPYHGATADLVECGACVAIATEMCKDALKHNEVLQEYDDRALNRLVPEGKHITPMPVVMAATLAEVCTVKRLRHYTQPPPILRPACARFLDQHHGTVVEFFSTFHRLGVGCRVAVDLLCAYRTRVCYEYDTDNIVVAGTETIAYSDPNAAPKSNSKAPRAFKAGKEVLGGFRSGGGAAGDDL
jgi:hypothetical protein